MIRCAFFLGLGLVLGSVVVMIVGPPGAGSVTFPIGLTLAIMAGTLWKVSSLSRGTTGFSQTLVQTAREEGRVGVARVDALRQTGTQINDQPLCDIEVTVALPSGRVFRTVVRRIVAVVEIARFQPGTRHAVAVASAQHPDTEFLSDDPGSPQLSALRIPPVDSAGEPQRPEVGAVRDPGRRGPLIGTGRHGRTVRVLAYVLIFLLAFVGVLYPYRDSVALVATALSHGELRADLREERYLEIALATAEEQIGHDSVFSVSVADDLLIIDAPIQVGAVESDRWTYRAGQLEHDGASPSQPEHPGEQFRVAEIALDALPAALEDARELSGLTGPEVDAETMFHISRSFSAGDAHAVTGPVQISFSLADDYHSAHFVMHSDGTDLTMTSRD